MTKLCPYCYSEIDLYASKCPHCCSDMPPTGKCSSGEFALLIWGIFAFFLSFEPAGRVMDFLLSSSFFDSFEGVLVGLFFALIIWLIVYMIVAIVPAVVVLLLYEFLVSELD